MTALLRAGGLLLGGALLAVLAVAGLALAAFSVPVGDDGLVPLFDWARLPELRDEAGRLLADLEAPGPIAQASAAVAAAVLVLGLLLVLGAVSGPERLLALRRDGGPRLAARRRAVRAAAAARARRVHGLSGARVGLRGRPLLPGRPVLRVRLRHSHRDRGPEIATETREALEPLAGPFGLRLRVRARLARRGRRET